MNYAYSETWRNEKQYISIAFLFLFFSFLIEKHIAAQVASSCGIVESREKIKRKTLGAKFGEIPPALLN